MAKLGSTITHSNGKIPLIITETLDYGFAKIVSSIEVDADVTYEMAKIYQS
jgi:hypothetical protein